MPVSTSGRPPETALAHSDDAFVVSSFSKILEHDRLAPGWLVAPERRVRSRKAGAELCISLAALAHAALACFSDAAYAIAEARWAEIPGTTGLLCDRARQNRLQDFIPPDGGFFVYADASVPSIRDSESSPAKCSTALASAFAPGIDFGEFHAREHANGLRSQHGKAKQDGVARLQAHWHISGGMFDCATVARTAAQCTSLLRKGLHSAQRIKSSYVD